MKKLFAALLSIFGASNAAAQATEPPSESITKDLRSMVLNLSPSEIGITPDKYPHKVWGVVMETGIEAGYYTLVILADGTTSLYFSNGGGIIGAGEKLEVRKASQQFLSFGNKYVSHAKPIDSTEPPTNGNTKFFFLTFDGTQTYTAPEVALGEQRDPLSNLFHSAHAVIAAVRQTQQ